MDASVTQNTDSTVSVGACTEHTFADANLLREWLDTVRVAAYETACPACAGVDLTEALPLPHHHVVSDHAKCCAECAATEAGDGGALFAEQTIAPASRTRAFCSAECQRSFYEAGNADGGMPPLHAPSSSKRMLVASVLRLSPEGRTGRADDKRSASVGEQRNATLFYERARGVPPVIRDHAARRARLHHSAVKPLFLTMGDALERLDVLDEEMARDEMRAHYVLWTTGQQGIAFGRSTLGARPGIEPFLSEQLVVKMATMVPQSVGLNENVRNIIAWTTGVEKHGNVDSVPIAELGPTINLVMANWDQSGSDNDTLGYVNQALSIILDLANSMYRYARDKPNALRHFDGLWKLMKLDRRPRDETLIRSAVEWIMGHTGFLKQEPGMFRRRYARIPNYEALNDVVAGMRVSSLVHSGVSPAFATVVDYFAVNAGLDGFAVADTNLFVVSEKISHSLRDVVSEMRDAGTMTVVNMARSTLAQVLLALEAAQSKLRFMHNDLHMGNVMLDALPQDYRDRDAVMRFRRPSGTNMFIPASHTGFKIARIIDFGRSRVDDPNKPTMAPPSYISMRVFKMIAGPDFDRWTDMRIFGHDFAVGAFVHLGLWNRLVDGDGHDRGHDVPDLLATLEVMMGMDRWTPETMIYKRYHLRQNGRAKLDAMLAPVLAAHVGGAKLKAYVSLWQQAVSSTAVLRLHGVTPTGVSEMEALLLHFRVTDIYGSNPSQETWRDPDPSAVLDRQFFQGGESGYRPDPRHGRAAAAAPVYVDFMGDAMEELQKDRR